MTLATKSITGQRGVGEFLTFLQIFVFSGFSSCSFLSVLAFDGPIFSPFLCTYIHIHLVLRVCIFMIS